MATRAKCGAQVFQMLASGTLLPMILDANPNPNLGMLKVDFINKTCRVLMIADRAASIQRHEDLYTNHQSTCSAREHDRSYQDDVERMVG